MIVELSQSFLFAFKKRSIFNESGFIFFLVADMRSFALLNNLSHIFDVGDTCFSGLYSELSSLNIFFWAVFLSSWSAYPRSLPELSGSLIILLFLLKIKCRSFAWVRSACRSSRILTKENGWMYGHLQRSTLSNHI